jgi:small conductance mechanosensitive channel
MPDFDFNFELSAVATGAVKVLIIILATYAFSWLMRKAIRRIITARIPQIREESTEQLASRSETLAGVVSRTVSFLLWIIAFMMILSVLGINVAPIIAAVGVAALAVGFAAR